MEPLHAYLLGLVKFSMVSVFLFSFSFSFSWGLVIGEQEEVSGSGYISKAYGEADWECF